MYIFAQSAIKEGETRDRRMSHDELRISRSPLSSASPMLSLLPPDGAESPHFTTSKSPFDEVGRPAPPSTNGHSVATGRSEHNEDMANGVDARGVLLCDLGSKALLVEDLENALRLWSRPAVLIAARNSLDRLPLNIPSTILYLDLSWNR